MGDKILHKYIPNITPHFAFLTTHILILLRFLARLTTENHGFLLHQQLLHNFHRVTHPLSQTYHIALSIIFFCFSHSTVYAPDFVKLFIK